MPRRDILALVPRVAAHPTHAVVDGITYAGGLAEYEALQAAEEESIDSDSQHCRACLLEAPTFDRPHQDDNLCWDCHRDIYGAEEN